MGLEYNEEADEEMAAAEVEDDGGVDEAVGIEAVAVGAAMDGENDGVEVMGDGAVAAAAVVDAAVDTPTSLCNIISVVSSSAKSSFFSFFLSCSIYL